MTPNQTYGIVRRAIAAGSLIRPDRCNRCGVVPPPTSDGRASIQAHHHDYNLPLDVEWICSKCHRDETPLPKLMGAPVLGEKNGQAKLTEKNIAEAKSMRDKGMAYKQIAMHFGVAKSTIRNALTGKWWSHLAAAPSIPDAEGQVRQGLSEAWLPIESAPDETPVWLLSAAGDIWIGERNFNGDGWLWGNCYMTVYLRGDGTWGSSDCQEDDDYQPTHWMPLPAPPAHNIQPPKGEA